MATYQQLSLYLLSLERRERNLLTLQKIGAGVFSLVLIVFLAIIYFVPDQIKLFSDIEGIISLSGITTSTLTTYLYSQAKLSGINERRIDMLRRISKLENSTSSIPFSFYEEVLTDSFKDSLKSK